MDSLRWDLEGYVLSNPLYQVWWVESGWVGVEVSHLGRKERGEDGAPWIHLHVLSVGASERKVKTYPLKSAKTFYT
jgi:hypothetical protein